MHSQIRRKRQVSAGGGNESPGLPNRVGLFMPSSISGRAKHCPCLWLGTLSLRVSSSCQTHTLNCQNGKRARSGKRKLWEMVIKRHPLNSLMLLIWGVTESGSGNSQQGLQQGITELCRYNVGSRLVPSPNYKGSQWSQDRIYHWFLLANSKRGNLRILREKAAVETKLSSRFWSKTRFWGSENNSPVLLVFFFFFPSFSKVPNSLKTPNSHLEIKIHDSKTEMDFSSSFWNFLFSFLPWAFWTFL